MPGAVQYRIFICVGLATWAAALLTTARVYFIEEYFCRTLHRQSDGVSHQCNGDPEVQAALARTTGIYDVLALIPSLVLTAPYAAWAPQLGRWRLLRLGAVGQMAIALHVILVVSQTPRLGIGWIWLGPLWDIIGGGLPVFQSLAYSAVADGSRGGGGGGGGRSSILFLLTAFDMLCGFVGMLVASQVLRYSGAGLLVGLGVGAWALVALTTTTIHSEAASSLPHPSNADDQEHQGLEAAEGSRDESAGEVSEGSGLLTTGGGRLTEDAKATAEQHPGRPDAPPLPIWRTFCHSYGVFWNSIRGDASMAYMVAMSFANRWALSIRVVFVPWAARAYGWTVADSTALNAGAFAISSVVLLALPWAEKTYRTRPAVALGSAAAAASPRLSVAKASLLLNALGIWGMGASTSARLYSVAMCVYSMGVGLDSDLQRFGSHLTTVHEGTARSSGGSTRVFLALGMASSVGGIMGTACWSQGFAWLAQRAAEDKRGPGVELQCCALVFAATLAIAWRLEGLGGSRR
jgi:hypothetical protein